MDVLLVIKDYSAKLEPGIPSESESKSETKKDPSTPSTTTTTGTTTATETTEMTKHLMARVWGTPYPLTNWSALHLMLTYPVTALATFPRIMVEAWKLAYSKGLPVYQRPNPYRVPNEQGGTILGKGADTFQM
jgi:hypothetical protein